MLSLEEMIEISNEMGIEIKKSHSKTHYILNEQNEKVELDLDKLLGKEDIETYEYNLLGQENPYKIKETTIKNSIINAA